MKRFCLFRLKYFGDCDVSIFDFVLNVEVFGFFFLFDFVWVDVFF